VPQSPDVALTARLETIKALADDLARVNGETLTSRALADAIMREVDEVSRALRQAKRC
jgi:hypothetical protein